MSIMLYSRATTHLLISLYIIQAVRQGDSGHFMPRTACYIKLTGRLYRFGVDNVSSFGPLLQGMIDKLVDVFGKLINRLL